MLPLTKLHFITDLCLGEKYTEMLGQAKNIDGYIANVEQFKINQGQCFKRANKRFL